MCEQMPPFQHRNSLQELLNLQIKVGGEDDQLRD